MQLSIVSNVHRAIVTLKRFCDINDSCCNCFLYVKKYDQCAIQMSSWKNPSISSLRKLKEISIGKELFGKEDWSIPWSRRKKLLKEYGYQFFYTKDGPSWIRNGLGWGINEESYTTEHLRLIPDDDFMELLD